MVPIYLKHLGEFLACFLHRCRYYDRRSHGHHCHQPDGAHSWTCRPRETPGQASALSLTPLRQNNSHVRLRPPDRPRRHGTAGHRPRGGGTSVPPVHGLSVSSLSVEHLSNPVGVEAPKPRLSWQLARSDAARARPRTRSRCPGARIAAADTPDIWDTGVSPGTLSRSCPTPDLLCPRLRNTFGVSGSGTKPTTSRHGAGRQLDHGLLAARLEGAWISPASRAAGGSYLRKSFSLPGKPFAPRLSFRAAVLSNVQRTTRAIAAFRQPPLPGESTN